MATRTERQQLTRADVALLAGVEAKTIDKLRERAASRRQAGRPLPTDIPEPDGYIGRSPYWWHGGNAPITVWLNSREGTTR